MRIFDTYREMRATLDLPPLEPGAFRFAPQYGRAGFVCSHCGAVKTLNTGNESISTGYGLSRQNDFVCFDCCHRLDLETMAKHSGPFYCYLASDGKAVTNWPGLPLGRVHSLGESRAGWHGSTIARFHVRDAQGQWWQGRGPGRGMCCTLRPMKTPIYAQHWGRA